MKRRPISLLLNSVLTMAIFLHGMLMAVAGALPSDTMGGGAGVLCGVAPEAGKRSFQKMVNDHCHSGCLLNAVTRPLVASNRYLILPLRRSLIALDGDKTYFLQSIVFVRAKARGPPCLSLYLNLNFND